MTWKVGLKKWLKIYEVILGRWWGAGHLDQVNTPNALAPLMFLGQDAVYTYNTGLIAVPVSGTLKRELRTAWERDYLLVERGGGAELEKPTREAAGLHENQQWGASAVREKEGRELLLESEAKGRAVWRPGLATWWELAFGRELRLTLQSTPRRTITLSYFPCTSGLLPGFPICQTHLASEGEGA